MDAGLDNEIANNRQLLSLISAVRGRAQDCRRYADQVLAQTRESQAAVLELLVYAQLGTLELGLGRPTSAVRELERARALAVSTGFRDAAHFGWPADLVEAYVRCGRNGDAATLAGELTAQAEETGRPIVAALAARCRGLTAGEDEFPSCFGQALDAHAATERPFETARTRLCFGQRLRRQRRRAAARVELRIAWETFAALGADCWTQQAHDELKATGVVLATVPRNGADLLTPQELQVAVAVSNGSSNREAAERLFVSRKTVEYHLSHIYRKLGIRAREELPAAMESFAAVHQPIPRND
jgi:ATP/maltotriose-dependent transcriptional regulator MalT